MGWLAHWTRPSELTAMTASCMLLSRVSSWRWLERTAAKLRSTCPAVLSMAAATRPISSRGGRRRGRGGRPLDAGRDIDDAIEAAGGPDGGDGGDEQGDEERRGEIPRAGGGGLAPAQLRHRKVDRRGGRRHRRRERPRREMECRGWRCGARSLRFAGEGGGEFLARGVVLHVGGIGFGVGKDFAGGVDDGGAGSGGLAFLGGDFGEGVGAVGFDAVGEEESFLSEVALDFGAQRGFPGAAEHDVENGGGGGDDDQEDGQQFEEDAVLHESGFPGPRGLKPKSFEIA